MRWICRNHIHRCLLRRYLMSKYKQFTLLSGIVVIDSKKYSWSINTRVGDTSTVYDSSFPRGYLMKDYYLKNQDKIKKRSVEWNKCNKKQKAATGKKWYDKTREHNIKKAVRWNIENKEKRKLICARHNKIYGRKYKARRRSMGFVELNSKFLDSHAHHVDNEQVIYIPEKLHRSVSHNLKTGRGMQRINVLAFEYLFGGDAYSKNN